jgi:hypothetical protein
MSNFTAVQRYRQITEWFHESEYGNLAPIEAVDKVFLNFIGYVQRHKLPLVSPEPFIWKSLCRATCALRNAYLCNSTAAIHSTIQPSRPKNWTDEMEEDWMLLLETICSSDIVDSFINPIPIGTWEHDVRNWREVIHSLLPDLIQPTLEVLERYGYGSHVNDEWVRTEDQEEGDEF